MVDGSAICIQTFHPTGTNAEFHDFAETIDGSARRSQGYVRCQVSPIDSGRLDRALAVTFESERDLHRWLDGAGATFAPPGTHESFRKSLDIVVDRESSPPGVGVFLHTVESDRIEGFVAAQALLAELSTTFSGFEGATLLEPADDTTQWISVIRFRTEGQLQAWLHSSERSGTLPELRSHLTEDFRAIARTPFGSILRMQDGVTRVTPKWKTNMLVLLVLYPTVLLLARFVDPLIRRLGTEVWLTMWLSQLISVSLLTWVLMPWGTLCFRRWLDPVDGARARPSVIGAAVVVAGYAACLAIFASVTWLQFWNN